MESIIPAQCVDKSSGKDREGIFTIQTYAILLTVTANNEDRWKAIIEWHNSEPNGWVKKFSKHGPKKKEKVNGQKQEDVYHDRKWSIDDAGSDPYKAWAKAGVDYYNEKADMIENKWDDAEWARVCKVDKAFLEKYQAELGVSGKTTGGKQKGKRSAGSLMDVSEEYKETVKALNKKRKKLSSVGV